MNYYNEIKNELINNEINRKVKNYSINKSDLDAYYNVGRMLSEAGNHYGEGIIEEYSKRLTYELGKGYSKKSMVNVKVLWVEWKSADTVCTIVLVALLWIAIFWEYK